MKVRIVSNETQALDRSRLGHRFEGGFHVFGKKLAVGVGFPDSLECYRIHGSDATFACSMLLSRERYESKLALSRSFVLFWPMCPELR